MKAYGNTAIKTLLFSPKSACSNAQWRNHMRLAQFSAARMTVTPTFCRCDMPHPIASLLARSHKQDCPAAQKLAAYLEFPLWP